MAIMVSHQYKSKFILKLTTKPLALTNGDVVMCTLPHRKFSAIAAVAIIFLSTMTPGQSSPAATCQEYPMPPQQVFQGIATRSDISQSSSLY